MQRTYNIYDERNGFSPTVNTDSFSLTGVIDEHENRSVAKLDIDNAFLHSENYEYLLILNCGKLAELLFKVDPELHQNLVIISKQGVPMLYIKLTKAMCAIL